MYPDSSHNTDIINFLVLLENGKTITKEEGFEGTKKEVDAAVDAFLNENVDVDVDTPETPETPESSL